MKHYKKFSVLFLCTIILILTCAHTQVQETTVIEQEEVSPPVARVIHNLTKIHGEVLTDNYYWMRDRTNPEVIEYLEAENEYTSKLMAHTHDLQEKIYHEIISRIKETDLSVPTKRDNYYYYWRTEEGRDYPIYCRKQDSLESDEEIILDQNILAEGYDYYEIGVFEISPDHKKLAYSVDTTGAEEYTLYIKDLESGELLPERFEFTGYSAAWSKNNQTLFYTTIDEMGRSDKLFSHKLGGVQKDDLLIFDEEDDAFFVYVGETKDKEFIILQAGTHTTVENCYLNADNPEGEFKLLYLRVNGIEHYIEHHNGKFFILTNENAENFMIVTVPVEDTRKENWKELIPHRDSVKITGFDLFANHLVIYERENALDKIRIVNPKNRESHCIEFPEPVYSLWGATNPDFNSNILRYNYTSFITPESVYEYNMDTKETVLRKQFEVLGGYDQNLYSTERIFADAKDGTKIPISLVYKKNLDRAGQNPLWLYSYGSYGDCTEAYFFSSLPTLLDRGFIYAIAHIRGGGEMGTKWHDQGKLLKKKNTFTDFIACAEHLIAQGYTSNKKLVISGESAGGLLIGAVLNMRPDLFKVAIATVPFVDVINTMLDSTLPLTVLEYDEWGNPNKKKYYHYMKSYSPYDNVQAKEYPNILITAGLNDSRVPFWEAAKWCAKLRVNKKDSNILLLKTDMGSGHGGASGFYDYFREVAFKYAFVFDILEIKE